MGLQIARIKVSENVATLIEKKTITSGLVGGTVLIEYDDSWAGLNKQIVFRTRYMTMNADGCKLPPEITKHEYSELEVGVYGFDHDGGTVIPTIWVSLGKIIPGADPSGDESVDPSLPVWAQHEKRISDLENASPDSSQNVAEWRVLHEAELTEEATIAITGFDTTLSEYVMSLIVPKMSAVGNMGNSHFLGARALVYSQPFGSTSYAVHYTYHATMISGGRMILAKYENHANGTGFDNDYSADCKAAKAAGVACDLSRGVDLRGAFPTGTKVRLEGR